MLVILTLNKKLSYSNYEMINAECRRVRYTYIFRCQPAHGLCRTFSIKYSGNMVHTNRVISGQGSINHGRFLLL